MAKKNIQITPLAEVVGQLVDLTQSQIRVLSEKSGVPYGTIMKIRLGETLNPGIETIRAFVPFIPKKKKVAP